MSSVETAGRQKMYSLRKYDRSSTRQATELKKVSAHSGRLWS